MLKKSEFSLDLVRVPGRLSNMRSESQRKPVRLNVTPDEHREIRIAAARLGITMTEMARESVLRWAREVNEKEDTVHVRQG